MSNILGQVDHVIASLQAGKWADHSPQLLISSQGKLASYMSNVGGMVANAEYEYRLKELNHEQYEKERYLQYRKKGMAVEDSKTNAMIDAFSKEKDVIEARKDWQELRSVLKAIESLSVACSTTLKHQQVDRQNSNNQGN